MLESSMASELMITKERLSLYFILCCVWMCICICVCMHVCRVCVYVHVHMHVQSVCMSV